MLFQTIDFAIFLPIVFILYWFVFNRNLKLQNFLIVTASYVFYGWWNWKFLSLLLFTSLLDYTIGLALSSQVNQNKRKILLVSSIAVNLSLLGFFKYYNFFVENFIAAFSLFGNSLEVRNLNIILPVGISFYTLQEMSYTIDVYRKKLNPTKNLVSFLAFVSFFPQLVAGPIERATHLLPQFLKKRSFDAAKSLDGAKQIMWGLFKKLVIADNCAEFANMIFNHSADYHGSTLILGSFFFTIQIYCDFSGYSDIAIGTARLFGFDIMQNFAFPYFSRNFSEFWRRWHISLYSWFRDYLYIPLGGGKNGLGKSIRNTFIIFIVSGLWHGANWTFIAFGLVNALYILPSLFSKSKRKNLDTVAAGKYFPNPREIFSMLFTFALTCLMWIFFRAENMEVALKIIADIFTTSPFTIPDLPKKALVTLILILFFFIIEWLGRENKYAIEFKNKNASRQLRWCFYSFLIFLISMYMNTTNTPFIYFQF